MNYQELLTAYKNAIRLRELKVDENYTLLTGIFKEKIINGISLTSPSYLIPYLAGMKEVFSFVEKEVSRIEYYKDELERCFQNKNT